MARKHGKMALYEVMSKAQAKRKYNKVIEPLKPIQKPEPKKEPEKLVEQAIEEAPQVSTKWRKKPRLVQYNLGRIEFSIPYQLAITIGLALLLCLLLAFKFGQASGNGTAQPLENERETGNSSDNNRNNTPEQRNPVNTLSATNNNISSNNNAGMTPPAGSANNTLPPIINRGNNVIVLAQYSTPAHLYPVQAYFKDNLILTEIVKVGDKYYLQTLDRFAKDPTIPGNDGYDLYEKIVQVGKGYQPPNSSYESFAPNYFGDAYGDNITR